MNNIRELLPIGSIVILENGQKKLMIIGVKPIDTEKNETYDYLAVPYPEGYVKEELTFFVNHDKIKEVISRGYENDERTEFINKLEEFYKNNVTT